MFIDGIDPSLLAPTPNVLRATLHPAGLAPRIANFSEWSDHLLRRLEREISITGDQQLAALLDEFLSYPGVRRGERAARLDAGADIIMPLRIRDNDGELQFFSTVTSFGSPLDATVADLTIEAFYPADGETGRRLRALRA